MTDELKAKLAELPKNPGVYFHKNAKGQIIYVGKAAVLKNRVRQYFQASRNRDPKTEALVAEIFDTDWIEVESEIEALFLEAEMVRRYMPQYNILLRDDKSSSYVRIDMKSEYPSVTLTRRPLDDGANYYGPFLNGMGLSRALHYLRKVFPYSIHTLLPKRGCLQYHLGICPGPETGTLDPKAYKITLNKLIMYLKGERVRLVGRLENEMQQAAKKKKFEEAAKLRNQLFALRSLNKQVIFSDRENMDLSKDHALNDLSELLGLEKIPRRIEGYDISHMSGTDTVASMVVFTNGVSDKGQYRKFKMRLPGNDDFAHMREVMTRRLSEISAQRIAVSPTAESAQRIDPYASQISSPAPSAASARRSQKTLEWKLKLPDLLLIDGGKGQLSSALEVLKEHDIQLPAIGLAKQFEEIVIKKDWPFIKLNEKKVRDLHGTILESDDFWLVNLPDSSHVVKLLQRIRDESHRFAVSYHTVLKGKRQVSSMLDDIPTIGPDTRKKLLRTFGSYKGIQQARQDEIEHLIGPKKATILRQYIRADRKGRG